jgi:hypothetical protein
MLEKPQIMKDCNMKNSFNEKASDDEMRAEYDFSDSKPNKYAAKLKRQERLVTIEPEVFKIFNNSDKVNNALKSVLAAMPKRSRKVQTV